MSHLCYILASLLGWYLTRYWLSLTELLTVLLLTVNIFEVSVVATVMISELMVEHKLTWFTFQSIYLSWIFELDYICVLQPQLCIALSMGVCRVNGHLPPTGNWNKEAKISRKCEISSLNLISWVDSCNDTFFADVTLTAQVSGSQLVTCSDEFAVHLILLLCLQRQVAKLRNELFYYCLFLRHNNKATNLRRCAWNYCGSHFAACNYWTLVLNK